MAEPTLSPIKNGWAARGQGWAVHAPTKEEAIERFRKAEVRHHEIDARPIVAMQVNTSDERPRPDH